MSGMYAMLQMLLNMERALPKHSALTDFDGPFEQALKAVKKLIFGEHQEVVNVSLVLQMLLYKGGDVNVIKADPDGDGWGIIHHAADQGAVEFLEWLFTVGAKVNSRTTKNKYTPLMCAARKDQVSSAYMTVLTDTNALCPTVGCCNGASSVRCHGQYGIGGFEGVVVCSSRRSFCVAIIRSGTFMVEILIIARLMFAMLISCCSCAVAKPI
jgi:hypothetical protein